MRHRDSDLRSEKASRERFHRLLPWIYINSVPIGAVTVSLFVALFLNKCGGAARHRAGTRNVSSIYLRPRHVRGCISCSTPIATSCNGLTTKAVPITGMHPQAITRRALQFNTGDEPSLDCSGCPSCPAQQRKMHLRTHQPSASNIS